MNEGNSMDGLKDFNHFFPFRIGMASDPWDCCASLAMTVRYETERQF
jgi:hypothetical protein